MTWKIALASNPVDSQIFYNDELVAGVTSVTVSQDANGFLKGTIELIADQASILGTQVDPLMLMIKCPFCHRVHGHECKGSP